ncbi:lysozyme [Mesorhizobium sp.]|uniref:lysozyme n=1 Tax=Mesorhizobium sp. TaxID=1871066 RepID=UPI003BAC13BA
MQTSPSGRAAIARREGNKLTAYLDSVGVLTIGVGHTSAAGAPKVTKGMKITAAQSDEILSRDLADVEASISSLVRVPLNQNEFDALVSLVFNIGAPAFKKSTVLKKLNAGNRVGAADAMLMWNKGTVDGKKVILNGLTSRRQDERAQFLTAASPAPAKPSPAPQTPALAPAAPVPPAAAPSTSPATKPAVAAGVFVIAAAAVANWWHELAAWLHSFF